MKIGSMASPVMTNDLSLYLTAQEAGRYAELYAIVQRTGLFDFNGGWVANNADLVLYLKKPELFSYGCQAKQPCGYTDLKVLTHY